MSRRTFGTIRRLPSGHWRARFKDQNGRQKAAPQTFTTKARGGTLAVSDPVRDGTGAILSIPRSAKNCCRTTRLCGCPHGWSVDDRYRLARSSCTDGSYVSTSSPLWGRLSYVTWEQLKSADGSPESTVPTDLVNQPPPSATDSSGPSCRPPRRTGGWQRTLVRSAARAVKSRSSAR
jgi:hypothetical protein